MPRYFFIAIAAGVSWAVSAGAAFSATITLRSASDTVHVDQVLLIDVILDTVGEPTSGVDLYYLHYDTTAFDVIDSDPSAVGVQVTPGALYPITAMNSVDRSTGRLAFSQVASGGTTFTGAGTLATIRLLSKKPGTTRLYLDHTLGNTADTNVALNGTDVLTDASDARITIKPAQKTNPSSAKDTETAVLDTTAGNGSVAIEPSASVTSMATLSDGDSAAVSTGEEQSGPRRSVWRHVSDLTRTVRGWFASLLQ